MAEKLFAQFLLESGAVSASVLMDGVVRQRAISFPLFAMVLDNGLIDDAQLETLDAERRKSGRKILELAVRSGQLSFRQLEELALIRAEKRLFLAEALVQSGSLSPVQAQQLLHQHRQEYPRTAPLMDSMFLRLRWKDIVLPFVRTTVSLYLHYTHQVLRIVDVSESVGDVQRQGYAFTQKLKGDKEFFYVLLLPEALVFPIASHIIGAGDKTVPNDHIMDAVLEFVNVVVGNACAELSGQGISLDGDLAEVLDLDTLNQLFPRTGIAVKMMSATGEFQILFRFNDSAGV